MSGSGDAEDSDRSSLLEVETGKVTADHGACLIDRVGEPDHQKWTTMMGEKRHSEILGANPQVDNIHSMVE